MKLPSEHRSVSAYEGETLWNHSAHIVDFVKAVVEDRALRNDGPEATEMVSSLRNLVQALEGLAAVRCPAFPDLGLAKDPANSPMPPLEAVVAVLRWAKGSSLITNGGHKPSNTNIRSRVEYQH